MTFEQTFLAILEKTAGADLSSFRDKTSYQLTVTGDGGGVISAEISGGRLIVEPRAAENPSCSAAVSRADLERMLSGGLDPVMALALGKIKIKGDLSAAMKLKELFLR